MSLEYLWSILQRQARVFQPSTSMFMAKDPQSLAARAAEIKRWVDHIVDLDFLMSASRT